MKGKTKKGPKAIVQHIHASPYKVVLAVAGGGAGCLKDLLEYGGGSATILEATIPYSQDSFSHYIGRPPDKFCSEPAARQLAVASYYRAVQYTGSTENVAGIGFTSALAKDRERENRKHVIFGAYHKRKCTASFTLELNKSRIQEEEINSQSIIAVIADACTLYTEDVVLNNCMSKYVGCSGSLQEILDIAENKSPFTIFNKAEFKGIFAGSWNPFHQAHREILEKAQSILGPIALELCIKNADKPPLDFIDISERLNKLRTLKLPLIVSNLATFAEKAQYFNDIVFVVGFDTANRILDPKYGKDMNIFLEKNIKFLIFNRENKLNDFPKELIYDVIEFNNDLSSTQIRIGNGR